MVRRFLSRHTPAEQEHMTFQARALGAVEGQQADPPTSFMPPPRPCPAACACPHGWLFISDLIFFSRSLKVAVTVMRIQRHWRAVAARRKAEREAARPVVPPLRLDAIRRG